MAVTAAFQVDLVRPRLLQQPRLLQRLPTCLEQVMASRSVRSLYPTGRPPLLLHTRPNAVESLAGGARAMPEARGVSVLRVGKEECKSVNLARLVAAVAAVAASGAVVGLFEAAPGAVGLPVLGLKWWREQQPLQQPQPPLPT